MAGRSVGAFKLANMLFLAHKKLDEYNERKSETEQELWAALCKSYIEILDEVSEVKKQLKQYKPDLKVDMEIIERLRREALAKYEELNVARAACCRCNIF